MMPGGMRRKCNESASGDGAQSPLKAGIYRTQFGELANRFDGTWQILLLN